MTKRKKKKLVEAKKISFDFPSHKKNLDHLKLLFSHAQVKDIIKNARKSLELPPDGLAPDQIEKWYASMHNRSQQIQDSKVFREQITSIKQNFRKNEVDAVMATKQSDLFYSKLPENYLAATVDYIVDVCQLPANYADSIRTYIIANVLQAPPHIFSEGPYMYAEKVDRSKFVTITFYAKLTDADLKELKKYVNNLAGTRMPDFQALAGVDKKIKIEEMYADRKRFDVATYSSYKITAKEVAENIQADSGSKTKVSDVYEAVRGIKELRKKRFKKLGNTP